MSAGTILAGKYRLLSLIGQGGMGSVWRAERLGWESAVAIKLMNLPLAHNPQALARFQREAELAANLRSIHVVQVLDDGVDDTTGAPFIVMELLEGESLAERLARMKCLKPPMVAQIITQIARALMRAHEAGLIHRDLKPDNVLLVRNDDEEVVKVLDFGIAKWVQAAANPEHGTLAGHVMGTPAYMSPEQLMSSNTIDQRADLWSLGIIACECMTGGRPFEGDSLVSLAFRICSGSPPLASSLGPVPEGFDAWFARAIALNPDQRFPSARVMAEELRGLCGQMPMLWVPDAVPPAVHTSSANTEFEPVLELTRRVERNTAPPQFPLTELASIVPPAQASSDSSERRGRGWVGIALVLVAVLALGGFALASTPRTRLAEVSSALARLTAGLGNRLRGTAPSVANGAADTSRVSGTSPAAGSAAPLPQAYASPLQPAQIEPRADATTEHAAPNGEPSPASAAPPPVGEVKAALGATPSSAGPSSAEKGASVHETKKPAARKRIKKKLVVERE